MNLREELINSFKDTIHFVNGNDVLFQQTRQAMERTSCLENNDTVVLPLPSGRDCEISVVEDTTFHAARKLVQNGKKTAVLNFASAVNPGGGVTIGAMAQEECLCRSSNLYFCLKQPALMRDYYMSHRIEKNTMYSDKIIYSPDVTVFKTDDVIPVLLPETDWFHIDVITCAAPNLREVQEVDEERLKKVFHSRIFDILFEAGKKGVDAIVLGAFGCGAFKNPPELVAGVFKEVIESNFSDVFEKIVFAIKASSNNNYEVFSSIFNEEETEVTREEFEQWRKTNPYYGKKFSIMGDSISALKSCLYPDYKPFYEDEVCIQSGVAAPIDTWWGKVISFFGGKLLVDNAYSGSRVTSPDSSFPAGISQKRIDELAFGDQTPDVVMVYLGFNDWANGVEVKCPIQRSKPISEYFDYAYFNMIIGIQKRYPHAEIWCLTLNPTFVSDDLNFVFPYEVGGVHIQQYNDVIRAAAQANNRKLVDLYALNIPCDTIDGSHPNAFGMATLAQNVCICVTGNEKMCVNETFYQNEFEQIHPNICYCKNSEHEFVSGEEMTGARCYYCCVCGKELIVPTFTANLQTYADLASEFEGSLFEGEELNEAWLARKDAELNPQSEPEPELKSKPERKPETLFCSHCGVQLRPGDKFCLKCGNKTALIPQGDYMYCKQCTAPNNPASVFCRICGSAFGAESGTSTGTGIQSENGISDFPEILDERYKIIRQVGKGASSIVFLAQDIKLERVCAVKMIRKNTYANAIAAEESLNEANKLKLLAHSAIPLLYDIYDDDERLCIVMEFIDGKNLRTVINEAKEPIDEKTLIGWAKQICNVLYYLHTLKPARIFRDLKPANILLQPNGLLKLIDFGTMKNFDDSRSEDTVNLGTKGYASPEQFGGKGATDARTDIYGFGMTMYHLITGVNPSLPPFEFKPIHEYRPDITPEFEQIIMKCIQVEREERYQSAFDIIIDLGKLGL